MIHIVPMYDFGDCARPIYISTDYMKLKWYSLFNYNPKFCKSTMSENLYKLRIWDMNNKNDNETIQLFQLMTQYERYMNKDNVLSIFDKKKGKIVTLKNSKNYEIIRSTYLDEEDEEDYDEFVSTKKKSSYKITRPQRYIMFKPYVELIKEYEYKLLTKVYYNNEQVEINSPTDLHKYIEIGVDVKIEFTIDYKMVPNKKCVFSRFFPVLRMRKLYIKSCL